MKENINILNVISSLNIGGAEKLVAESIPFFKEKGINVDVLSIKNEKTFLWEKILKSDTNKIFGLSKGSVYNPFLIFKIIPYLKHYDVVHAHLFPTLYWVVLAKWLSFSKTKIVYTEHNTNNRRRQHFLLKYVDKLIYKGISKIVTIAEEVDTNLKLHLGFSKERFTMINNGVNLSTFINAFSADRSFFYTTKDLILIQVSSFREQKDQPTLIKSLLNLPNDVKLILVGDGPLRKDNEKLVEELNLTDRVQFLGIRTDIPNLLKMADVVVLSSFHEGMSLSSIEGMAVKPFIASNVPGLKEIVQGSGLLFERGDEMGLAKLILQLKENREFYDRIKESCNRKALQFDISLMVNKYVEVYKSVLIF